MKKWEATIKGKELYQVVHEHCQTKTKGQPRGQRLKPFERDAQRPG